MIPVADVATEKCFTHVDADGTVLHFAVERMVKWVDANAKELTTLDVFISPRDAEMIFNNNGIEKHRLERIRGQIEVPVIWCEFPPRPPRHEAPTHVLVDGSHRFVAAYMQGHRTIKSYMLKKSQWEPFLVDFPLDASPARIRALLSKMNSGIA